MPSTYTTNNGIEKIGTGEQSGTWGDTTNLNFDILDQSLDGQVTITATDTGSSGSPNTLPITDGSLSDGRNRLIIITDGGDLGGSVYYQLTPADAEKIIFLRNDLSGSQDLILFQGTYNAARDLIVPAGKDVIIKFSGGGTSNAVVAPVFADLNLDAATIASVDINGGTIDGVTIGTNAVATDIRVDNLKLDGNTLSSTDTDGNVVIAPNGDGDVQLDADTIRVGDSNTDVTITTNGTGDLTLNTNGGTNSGSIEIQDGVNTNIIVTANGTGKLELANGDITTSAASGSDAAGQDLTIQAGASTGNAAGGDMIFQTTPAGAGSGSVLNSYTTVLTLTDDSKMQIGTSTAVDSILDEDTMSSDSATALATQQSIKAYVDAQVGANNELSEVLANGNTTGGTDISVSSGDDITFADSSKAIFGAGSNLQIYYDGTNSYVEDAGAGVLNIKGDIIRAGLGNQGYFDFLRSSYTPGSSGLRIGVGSSNQHEVKTLSNIDLVLKRNDDEKLRLISTGVDITGDVGGDSATISGDLTVDTDTLYVDSSNDRVGIGESAPLVPLHLTTSSAGEAVRIQSDDAAGGAGPILGLYRNSSSPIDGDSLGAINFYGEDSAGNQTTYASIETEIYDVSNGTEDGRLHLKNQVNGALTSRIYMNAGETIVNESGADIDFRVESDNHSHMFFVDAGANGVSIGEGYVLDNGLYLSTITGTTDAVDTKLYIRASSSGTTTTGFGPGITFAGERNGDGAVQQMARINAVAEVNSGTTLSSGLQFMTATAGVNSEKLRITNDGDVGIDQDSPIAKLHVNSQDVGSVTNLIVSQLGNTSDTSFVAQEFKFNEGGVPGAKLMAGKNAFAGTDFYIYTGQASNGSYVQRMKFYGAATTSEGGVVFNEDSYNQDFRVESDSNSSALFIDASTSNVGINTGSPSTGMLTINGSANYVLTSSGQARNSGIHVDGGAAGGNNTYGGAISFGTGSGSAAISSVQNSSDGDTQGLAFHTHPSGTGSEDAQEKMRLTALGRLGINEQSPDGHLHITGTNESDGATIYLQEANNNTSDNLGRIYFGNNADSTLANILAFTSGDNTTSTMRVYTTDTGTSLQSAEFGPFGNVFNNGGVDMDFRVESNNNTHALFVDAGNDRTAIGTSTVDDRAILTTNGAIRSGDWGYNSEMKWFSFYDIGDSTASDTTYFLLAKKRVSGFVNATGLVGHIYLVRGTNAAWNDATQITVNIKCAYDSNQIRTWISTYGLLEVTYDSEVYYAFSLPATGVRRVYFQGNIISQGDTWRPFKVGSASVSNVSTVISANAFQIENQNMNASSQNAVFNESSQAAYDFRVESDSNDHMLFVDSGLNQVRIGAGTTNAPSTYPFISYAGGTSGRSAFVHAAGDGGVVISGSAGGSQAALIMGNNWGSNGATFSEEWRMMVDGTYDSLVFKFGGTNAALNLSAGGQLTTYYGSVFNENAGDYDFRVESDTSTHAIFVDSSAASGAGAIGFRRSDPGAGVDANAAIIGWGGGGQILQSIDNSVANGGYVDLVINSGGGGFTGQLFITNTVAANAAVRTHKMYFVAGRGTDCTTTQLGTDTGGSGGADFSITFPSNGTVRVTNNNGSTCQLVVAFIGSKTL